MQSFMAEMIISNDPASWLVDMLDEQYALTHPLEVTKVINKVCVDTTNLFDNVDILPPLALISCVHFNLLWPLDYPGNQPHRIAEVVQALLPQHSNRCCPERAEPVRVHVFLAWLHCCPYWRSVVADVNILWTLARVDDFWVKKDSMRVHTDLIRDSLMCIPWPWNRGSITNQAVRFPSKMLITWTECSYWSFWNM